MENRMNLKKQMSRVWMVSSLVVAFGAFVTTAYSQTSSGGGSNAFGSGSSGPAYGGTATTTDNPSGGSGITHPKSGSNNDPALQEPKAGPAGAPGVLTGSGSPDANGMRSNATNPQPT